MINSDFRIIQSSPGRTGSTLLTNILYGLFYDRRSVYFSANINDLILEDNFIVKTHDLDIDTINANTKYNLFFVVSERQEINQTIYTKYRSYKNVIIFSYETELKESNHLTIPDIVTNIYHRLLKVFPSKVSDQMNICQSINRIYEMNNFYETIKNKPFSYYDDYYKIHGSHRNRTHI